MENVQAHLMPTNLATVRFPKTIIGAGPVLRLKAAPNDGNVPAPAIPTPGPPDVDQPDNNARPSSETNVSPPRIRPYVD